MIAVEIVTDGGSAAGMGHLMRSAALARHLRGVGDNAWLQPATDAARDVVDPDLVGNGGTPDVAVIDLPMSGDAWIARYRKDGRPTLGLDYVGGDAPTLTLGVFDRGSATGAGERRFGFEYVIIRDDIRAASPTAGDHIVVMLGGGDVRGESATAARRAVASGRQVILVDGPLAPSGAPPIPGVDRRRCPTDLPQLMAGCAWAVTNAGGSMLEMLFLGKPVVAVPQTDAEVDLAGLTLDAGALLGIGLDAIAEPDARAANVGATAKRLVDGRGLDRITDALHELAR